MTATLVSSGQLAGFVWAFILAGFVWAFILLAAAILVIDGARALRGWIIRRGADYEAERFESTRQPSHVGPVRPLCAVFDWHEHGMFQ